MQSRLELAEQLVRQRDNDMNVLRAETQSHTSEAETWRTVRDDLIRHVSQLEHQLEQRDQSLATERQQAEFSARSSAEEIARLQSELARLGDELKTGNEQLEQQVAEKQLFETQYAQFQDEFEAHDAEHQRLVLVHKQLGLAKAELEAEMAAWPARLQEAQRDADTRVQQVMQQVDEERLMSRQREAQIEQQFQLQLVWCNSFIILNLIKL